MENINNVTENVLSEERGLKKSKGSFCGNCAGGNNFMALEMTKVVSDALQYGSDVFKSIDKSKKEVFNQISSDATADQAAFSSNINEFVKSCTEAANNENMSHEERSEYLSSALKALEIQKASIQEHQNHQLVMAQEFHRHQMDEIKNYFGLIVGFANLTCNLISLQKNISLLRKQS